jgi:hypothetical protein
MRIVRNAGHSSQVWREDRVQQPCSHHFGSLDNSGPSQDIRGFWEIILSKRPYLLQPNPKVRHLPMNTPSITINHRDQICLSGSKLPKDNHPGPRGVDTCPLVQHL